MANQGDSGDKTEKATPKRLRDARKRGDVPKSKDVTNTLGLAFTLALFALVFGYGITRLASLLTHAISITDQPFEIALKGLATDAFEVLLALSAIVLLPIAAFGMLVEFLQSGPIFALDKVKPKLENLSPVSGVQRMFSMDNFVEVLKSIGKTAILFVILWFVVSFAFSELAWLPASESGVLVDAVRVLLIRLFGWTLGIFLLIMALDAAYQQHSFAKKMRMSIRDIRQEGKDSEGDPMVKGQRRQMHKEFAEESASDAARSATVLVVNPTHVAVAILYDKDTQPVPIVTAKAQDAVALAMRDAAAERHVPVVRNERLARTLLADVDEGDIIPRGMFDVVAEVILWATRTRALIDHHSDAALAMTTAEPPGPAPGEDLTDYPEDLDLAALNETIWSVEPVTPETPRPETPVTP